MLWGSVPPAHACYCSIDPSLKSRVDSNDIVAAGTILDVGSYPKPGKPPGFRWSGAYVQMDSYLKGSGPPFVVDNDSFLNCSFFEPSHVSKRMILFLSADFETSLCSGNEAAWSDNVARVEAITGPGQPPSDHDDLPSAGGSDFPYVPAIIAAILGPVAFLAASAFLFRRRAGT